MPSPRRWPARLAARSVTVERHRTGGSSKTDMSGSHPQPPRGDVIKKMIPRQALREAGRTLPRRRVFLGQSRGRSYITGQIITVDGGLSLGRCPSL